MILKHQQHDMLDLSESGLPDRPTRVGQLVRPEPLPETMAGCWARPGRQPTKRDAGDSPRTDLKRATPRQHA